MLKTEGNLCKICEQLKRSEISVVESAHQIAPWATDEFPTMDGLPRWHYIAGPQHTSLLYSVFDIVLVIF